MTTLAATAHALDLVGERWALLVMRELIFGPKRFSDLRAGLPGISANVLTQRLEGLEQSGIVVRRRLPPPAAAQVYELTEWGYESEPIFQVLGRWAARSPSHDPTLPFGSNSLLLSLRTMLDPARAEGFAARIGFHLGAETFVARARRRAASTLPPARSTSQMSPSPAPPGSIASGHLWRPTVGRAGGQRRLAHRRRPRAGRAFRDAVSAAGEGADRPH